MESTLLYRRIRNHIACLILDEDYREGDALPSVRTLAVELGANPLTVAKGYQPLLEEGVVKIKRGVGFFIAPNGVERLRKTERDLFLCQTWPEIAAQLKRLQIDRSELRAAGTGATEIKRPQSTR